MTLSTKISFTTPLRSILNSGKTAYGCWMAFACPPLARTILRSASTSHAGPFSWVLIDAEHGLIGDRDYYELVNSIASEGASPIIRVPWAEEWMIKRALDSGAHGILTPMCHTAADAAMIVRYSKYPPKGTRGYGPIFAFHSLSGLGPGDPAYDEGAQTKLIVAVQIESRQGVDNAASIAAVDGVDVLLVGPFDLAKQIGVIPGGTDHEAAIQKVLKAAHGAGKKAAIFCLSGAQARLRVQQGFDMVSVSTDSTVAGEAMVQHLGTANGTLTPVRCSQQIVKLQK